MSSVLNSLDLTDPTIMAGLLLIGGLIIFLSPLINVLQLFGVLLLLGGICIYTTGSLRIVRGAREKLHSLPERMNAATAALRAADSAKQAAEAAQAKTVVDYLPSLDMFFADKSVGAYLSDNMFKLTDPHPAGS